MFYNRLAHVCDLKYMTNLCTTLKGHGISFNVTQASNYLQMYNASTYMHVQVNFYI